MSDDLTIVYMMGVEDMRSRLHKQADEIERLRAENEKLREVLSNAAGELRHAYIMGFTERYRDAAIAASSAATAIRESGDE